MYSNIARLSIKMKTTTIDIAIDIAMFLSLLNEAKTAPKIGINQNRTITSFVSLLFLFLNHAFEYLDNFNSFI